MKNKGLARLIFLIVFLIPVAWYLILQLFGSNNFALELKGEIESSCGTIKEITAYFKSDSVSIVQKNYLDRAVYGTEKRSISLSKGDTTFFACINQSESDIVLVSEEGFWGGYTLTRDGVDLFLTELDILLLKASYGKGARR